MSPYLLISYQPLADGSGDYEIILSTTSGTILSRGLIQADVTLPTVLKPHTILSIICGLISGSADVTLALTAADTFNATLGWRISMAVLSGTGIGVLNAASSLDASFQPDYHSDCYCPRAKFIFSIGLSVLASLAASILAVDFSLTISNVSLVNIIVSIFVGLATFYATIGDTLYGIQHIVKYTANYLKRTDYHSQLHHLGVNPVTIPLLLFRITMIFIAFLACGITLLGTSDLVDDFFNRYVPLSKETNYMLATTINFSEFFSQMAWLVHLFSELENALLGYAHGLQLTTADKWRYAFCVILSLGFGYALGGVCADNYENRIASWFGDSTRKYKLPWMIAGALPAAAVTIQAPLIKKVETIGGRLFMAGVKLYNTFNRRPRSGSNDRQPLLPHSINE